MCVNLCAPLYLFEDFGFFAGTGNQLGQDGFKKNVDDLYASEFQLSYKMEVKIYWFFHPKGGE